MNVINKPQKEFDNDIEYHLPKYLVNHKYYKNLYNKKHREFVKVITGLENSKDVDEDKLNKYKYWLKAVSYTHLINHICTYHTVDKYDKRFASLF